MTKPNVHAVHRDWDRPFPAVARTEGIYLYDENGKKYIDGSGGSSVVTSIGHGVSEIAQVMFDQAQKFSFYPAHAFTNERFLDLCDLVVSLAPGGLKDNSRVWITCTGTDATDDAVRLARQYWVECDRPSKYMVVGRWQGFHGNNLAVAGFSGITSRRRIFQPMFVESPHLPPAFCYRCSLEKTYPECGMLCARMLETIIRQHGADNIAAFIAEPVVGAALGCAPAPDGYFQVIRQICDRYEILFIDDEVMTGWGRTGAAWGIDHWGVTPDIIATAKGMTAGYTPLSAVIARDDIWGALERNHSPFKAGHTLNANVVSCAGAIAVINYSLDHRLSLNSRLRGEQALAGLREMMNHHPILGDVRGKGLMAGVEFVRNKATKAPFPVEYKFGKRLFEEAFARGLVIFPGSGTIDGVEGDHILMAPPFIITESQVDDLLAILDEAITAVENGLPADLRP